MSLKRCSCSRGVDDGIFSELTTTLPADWITSPQGAGPSQSPSLTCLVAFDQCWSLLTLYYSITFD